MLPGLLTVWDVEQCGILQQRSEIDTQLGQEGGEEGLATPDRTYTTHWPPVTVLHLCHFTYSIHCVRPETET